MFKAKVWTPIIAVFLIAAVLLGYFYFGFNKGLVPDTPGDFSKLLINTAYAQDNFEVEAASIDSTGIAAGTTFMIKSKDAIKSFDSLADNISFSPAVDYEITQIDEHNFKVIPKTPLEARQVYRLAIDSKYIDDQGDEQKRNYSWAFQVKDQFKVLHTLPRNQATYVPTDTGIELTFSHENFANYEDKISIEPALDGHYEKHKRTLVFVPKKLDPGTVYTVTMKKGVTVEGSDTSLAEDYVFSFETSPTNEQRGQISSSSFGFSVNFNEFPDTMEPAFAMRSYNVTQSEFPVKIFAFNSADHFIEALQSGDHIPYWATYSRDAHKFDRSKLTDVASYNLPLTEYENTKYLVLPEALDKGFYLIEAEYNGRFSQAYIQVSNISAYSSITKTDTLVWVNSLDTKGPVTGASIKVANSNVSATTDSDGVATFSSEQAFGINNEENDKKDKYLKVESGSSVMVVPFWLYRSYFSSSSNTDFYWHHFYTDRTMYQPDDVINFWAFIKPRSGEHINGQVKVRLSNSRYYNYYNEQIPIAEELVELDTSNTGIGNMRLKNLTPGGYSLQLLVDDEVVYSKYISVQSYTKPAYKLEALPEKKAVFAGDNVEVDITSSFFEGTPVADLDLSYSYNGKKMDIVTDDLGKAHISLPTTYTDCGNTDSYCYYPKSTNVYIAPSKSEEGEITTYAYASVYGPKIGSAVKFSKEKNSNQATITTSVYNIDLNKINSGEDYSPKGGPAVGKSLRAGIVEVTYEKEETGEYYDFINKITHKKYKYNRIETPLTEYSGTTDGNGEHVYNLTVNKDKSYYVRVVIDDGSGRHDVQKRYLYSRYTRSADNDYYKLQFKNADDSNFAIGEQVEFEFLNNEVLLPETEQKNYLYYHLQRGLIEHETSNQPEHNFTFKEQYIPNIYAKGVWFDGTTYHNTSYNTWGYGGITGNLVAFDKESRRLNIDIQTDKKDYVPGEEVNISVKVTDENGGPVKAGVNINLVDEAYYQLRNEQVDTLASIYNVYMSAGELTFYSSHRSAEAFGSAPMAEGGGCFLADTKIKMADGSEKNIEDVKTGDKVLTFADEKSHRLVEADVVNIVSHTVDGYLIINNKLKVTPEHRVFVNGAWQMIGEAKVGDYLIDEDGKQTLIDSIEAKHELVKVYNLTISPYNTYIANGIYVHNDKGGPREEFVDNALFTSLDTNSNGQASTSLTLPDNITSWRITTQAVSNTLFAGSNTANINVSLPVFVEASYTKEYLIADKPTIKLRAYGTALSSGDNVAFSMSADTLNFSQSEKSGRAFQPNYIDLPQLTPGQHKISTTVDFGNYQDTVIKPIEVVESRLRESVQNFYVLDKNLKPEGSDQFRTNLTFSDRNQGMVYRQLRRLSWTYGDRVDQELSRVLARKMLKSYFDEDSYYQGKFESDTYQLNNGGIALLPYSDAELELSARLAYVASEEFDAINLANYFYITYNSNESNQEEVAVALFGLASLGEPVLLPLQNFAKLGGLTVKERLYIALGAQKIGDGELARKMYLDIMSEYGEEMGDMYTRLNTGGDKDDHLAHTSLAAILSGAINDPYHESLWQYVQDNHTKDILINLEKLSYVVGALPNLNPGEVKFKVEVGGQKIEKTLSKGGSYKLSVTPEELKDIKFSDIEGKVGLLSSYEVPMVTMPADSSPQLNIRKEYYVDGQKTNSFKENDLVEVRIYPGIAGDAVEGYYQVTDLMPSGMAPVTRPYSRNMYNSHGCSFRYPYNIDGQRIKFNVNRGWDSNCSDYFVYYARVVNPGQYVVEPILVQHYKDNSIFDYSTGSQVNISRP
jgi:hypothetical protein